MIARYTSLLVSVFGGVMVMALGVLAWQGVPLGIDFTGGSSVVVRVEEGMARQRAPQLKEVVAQAGGAAIEVQVRDPSRVELRWRGAGVPEVIAALREVGVRAVERVAEVGPTLSSELRAKAGIAVALVFVLIVVYLAIAFRTAARPVGAWWYGVAAVVALIHDVLIPTMLVSLAAGIADASFDLLFVVALLAIAGYSVNDTIVVLDRIRELLGKVPEHETVSADRFAHVVDAAVRGSLRRSALTSATTALALVAFLLWGGESTRWFALTLLVGVVAGTLSSLLFAPALLVVVARWRDTASRSS